MNVVKTVKDCWSADNGVLYLVTEEIFQVQSSVESALIELNEKRQDGQKIKIVMHDPLVGFHLGSFNVDVVDEPSSKPSGSLEALSKLIDPDCDDSIPVEDHDPILPQDDAIVVLKGWESLLRPEERLCPDFVQALSNITQGNRCTSQWKSYLPEDIPDNVDADYVQYTDHGEAKLRVRGKRMLVFLAKSHQLPQDLTELQPDFIPLPTAKDFEPIVRSQIESMKNRGEEEHFHDIHDVEHFQSRVSNSLEGFPLNAAEDALMLSLVENHGFSDPGTFYTIERLKSRAIARVPGLTYRPTSNIETTDVVLPGYQPLYDFVSESMGMDEEFAAKHGIRPLKGVFIAGPPGVGKSVSSDQIALWLGKPQLIWSMGESQGSLVSESERNCRAVINVANALGAVLTLDDVDKAGITTEGSSKSDGGVFDRMINILLTEMADPRSRITWVINGNRVHKVRPELYRDGRVDERFFADLPDAEVRQSIVKFHMRKLNFPDNQFHGMTEKASGAALEDLCSDGKPSDRRTLGWSGAELAGIVMRAARVAAKDRREALDFDSMLKVVKTKKPQSQQMSSKDDYSNIQKSCQDFIRVGVAAVEPVSRAGSRGSRSRKQAEIES